MPRPTPAPRLEYPPRPMPPSLPPGIFSPAPELSTWVRETFLAKSGPFWTDEHEHLLEAKIVWTWTNTSGKSKGRELIGQAEISSPRGGQWSKLRDFAQICRWWRKMPDCPAPDDPEEEPDFTITLYAPWCSTADDASFCALVDHELFHCAQDTDVFDVPAYNQMTGRPKWKMRGHDVEQFVPVVRRWGAPAARVRDLVDAAMSTPEIAPAKIAAGCGTCAKAA